MENEYIETIRKFIAEDILRQADRVISPTEGLISTGLVDSFSLMDLALFIETKWGIRLEDTDLNINTFDSLEDLSNLIISRLKKN